MHTPLFQRQNTRRNTIENTIALVFRLATYFVVLCAGYIFLNIGINGSKVLFKTEAPFINTQFLTQKPQTLHVFEPKEIVIHSQQIKTRIIELESEINKLAQSESSRAIRADIKDRQRSLETQYEALEKQRKQERLVYSDNDYRALATLPNADSYIYSNYAYSGGGIGPAIIGTGLLVTGSISIAMILGVLCAIYLSEYSRPGRTLKLIRLSILNLSGLPSIVFGLFGFGMFVLFFGWGVSLIAGWFTLAIMALPIIITASEESLRAVPRGFREGSLALGASQWTSIRTNVLPYALPGILTSSIMGIARVAGETAPILFTAAFALRDQLPWDGLEKPSDFFFQGVMALPYHIYVVSSKIPQNEYTRDMQYGTAFVFLCIVGMFALTSILLRIRLRERYNW